MLLVPLLCADAINGRNVSSPLDAKAGLPARHLLQAPGDFNTSFPLPLSGSDYAPWNASDPSMSAYNSSVDVNTSYVLPIHHDPGTPCSSCNEVPAWVFEAIANASAAPPPTTAPSCAEGDSNATCAAPPPPPAPAHPAILLVQSRHDDAATNATHFFTHVPQVAVDAVARAIFENAHFQTWQQPPGLPDAFGCAGWPPVEAAIAAAAGVPPSAPAPAPAMEAAGLPAPQPLNVSCTVDALVATNLLVGALLEQRLPCTNDERGAAMNGGYSRCIDFTVTWLPPGSRCGANTSACVSHTF